MNAADLPAPDGVSAPDGLLRVHGELLSSDDWEIVDAVDSAAAPRRARFTQGDPAEWDGWEGVTVGEGAISDA